MLALTTLTKIAEGKEPNEFATSSCLFPRRRRIRLSEDGSSEYIYTPCGKCINCQSNRRNELASRMFLHSLSYEYCYFVTLTYGSYNLFPFKYHPFLADWMQTIPVRDSNNSLGHPCWTPSILVQSHLVKFIKRLRVQTGFDISYAACGEYGTDFKRPHYHLILYSHQRMTAQDIRNAWSLECKRTSRKNFVRKWRCDLPKTPENGYFRFYLGRVDFNDLWANGSLNYDGKHCGQYTGTTKDKNAMHNFTYVAKYIGKNDPLTWSSNMPLYFNERLQMAYNLYTGNIDKLAEICPQPEYTTLQLFNTIQNTISYGNNQTIRKIDFLDFKKIISPFFLSSRRPSLGKSWYLENRKAILEERVSMPKFMGKALAYPSYFFRLASYEKYPVRLRKIADSGMSYTKDLLPRVYEYFQKLREDRNYFFAVRGLATNYNINARDRLYAYALTDEPRYLYGDYIKEHSNTLDSVELLSPVYGTIHYVYNPHYEIFEGFQFDRSRGEYYMFDYYEREDFCDLVIDLIEKEYQRFPDKLDKLRNKTLLYDTIMEDPLSEYRVENYQMLHNQMQRMYKVTHKTDNQ